MGTFTFVGVSPGAPEGTRRLLAHLAGLERLLAEESPGPARERLEQRVGPELAGLLVEGLTPERGRRRDVV
ncbi:MAG: hypothetical protein IT201_09385 [Thermoleophilia bacterium]|nr:hypothetical protein [Thermoleophilia bacterium]